MNGMRTEASVSLTIVWDPRTPIEAGDVPVMRAFLASVRGMMQIPAGGVRLRGPLSMLEAAFETQLPADEAVPTLEEATATAVRAALRATRGNRTHAATRLGVHLRTMRQLIARHGLAEEFPVAYRGRPRAALAASTAVLA